MSGIQARPHMRVRSDYIDQSRPLIGRVTSQNHARVRAWIPARLPVVPTNVVYMK
jgi:hypothetical protein